MTKIGSSRSLFIRTILRGTSSRLSSDIIICFSLCFFFVPSNYVHFKCCMHYDTAHPFAKKLQEIVEYTPIKVLGITFSPKGTHSIVRGD